MKLGLVGRKIGMTRIFTDDGTAVPVTVLDVGGNRVTQIKTADTDGYTAVQVTFGKRRASRVNKAQAGHLAKAGVEAGELLREFPVPADEIGDLKPGTVIGVDAGLIGTPPVNRNRRPVKDNGNEARTRGSQGRHDPHLHRRGR